MKRQRSFDSEYHQRGVTVAISMVLLIMMTALGVTALKLTQSDELIAGNMQQEIVAFQGAETGLSMLWDGVESITTATTALVDDTVTYICSSGGDNCSESTSTRYKTKLETNRWYVGESNSAPSGYSLESGIVSHYFALESQATHAGKTSRIESGYYRVGPGSKK